MGRADVHQSQLKAFHLPFVYRLSFPQRNALVVDGVQFDKFSICGIDS